MMMTIKIIVGFLLIIACAIFLLFAFMTARPAYYHCADNKCVTIVDYYQGGGFFIRVYEGKIYSRFLLDKRDHIKHIIEGNELCLSKNLIENRIQISMDYLPTYDTRKFKNLQFMLREQEDCLKDEIAMKDLINMPLLF